MAYIRIVLPKIWGKGLYYPKNGKMSQNRKTHSPTGLGVGFFEELVNQVIKFVGGFGIHGLRKNSTIPNPPAICK